MKGIARATAAVILTVTIAACGADPLGPNGQAATATVSANLVIGSPTIDVTATTSTSCEPTSEGVLTEASTYVVAYWETPETPEIIPEVPPTATSCTPPCESTTEGVVAESSTYVVAYGETPPETTSCEPAPVVTVPPADTAAFKLSFP